MLFWEKEIKMLCLDLSIPFKLSFFPHTSKGKREWRRSVGVLGAVLSSLAFQMPNKTMTADASRPLEVRTRFCSAESIIDSSILLAPEKCMIKVRQKSLTEEKLCSTQWDPEQLPLHSDPPPTPPSPPPAPLPATTIFSSNFKSITV